MFVYQDYLFLVNSFFGFLLNVYKCDTRTRHTVQEILHIFDISIHNYSSIVKYSIFVHKRCNHISTCKCIYVHKINSTCILQQPTFERFSTLPAKSPGTHSK